MIENDCEGPRESSLLLGRSICQIVFWNVTMRSLRQHPVELIVNHIVNLDKTRGLEVDSNVIDELVEKYNQKLMEKSV
ncbi:hypothetical protein AVEN_220990-1 [Araneus ventricosus]|uniref:Uncharacterized protein n=1 Tax=Araneus ventricosus TaxID=182803 RepID=A0A4Y2EM97_ARAVE|nr:hypothetical protein AVEN_220990-1 [Araneus ventricosus]